MSRAAVLAAAVLCAAGVTTAATPAHSSASDGTTAPGWVTVQPDWASAGQNGHNTHDAATELLIGPSDVGRLAPKWTFTTAGDVSATPTVVNGTVYVPDWGGQLWAIDSRTGTALWQHAIADYDGIAGDVSRTSPAYWQGELITGTGGLTVSKGQGSYLLGIDARTGALRWKTSVDADPAAIVTGSPTVDRGVVYVGVSSLGESETTPTFRGSVEALDAATGALLWKTYTVPAGYSGGPVWGSQPVVDHRTGMLYVDTGNNYATPAGVCATPVDTACTAPPASDHFDSVLGLSLCNGAIAWSRPTLTADTWNLFGSTAPDADFGADPNLYTTVVDGRVTDLLGVGQKSGIYWALDPATGAVVWHTQVGPGGLLGGILWGTATDGRRIYAEVGNSSNDPYTLTAADGTTSTTTGGAFVALDAATGRIDWQTADPQAAAGNWLDDSFVSSANGVMYAGSSAPTGTNMYALDAVTGRVLWGFASGGSVFGGAAIADGNVYWGSGYHTEIFRQPYSGDNDKLYDFTLDGH